MLNPKKLTFKKLVATVKNCLTIVSSCDSAHVMIKYNIPQTEENIANFNVMADKFYKIRMQILRELVLKESKEK